MYIDQVCTSMMFTDFIRLLGAVSVLCGGVLSSALVTAQNKVLASFSGAQLAKSCHGAGLCEAFRGSVVNSWV